MSVERQKSRQELGSPRVPREELNNPKTPSELENFYPKVQQALNEEIQI